MDGVLDNRKNCLVIIYENVLVFRKYMLMNLDVRHPDIRNLLSNGPTKIIIITWMEIGRYGYRYKYRGFPGGSEGKEFACNVGDPGSIPGLGRPPAEGNGNPLQYPCLENPMDRGAWWATVHRVPKSRT